MDVMLAFPFHSHLGTRTLAERSYGGLMQTKKKWGTKCTQRDHFLAGLADSKVSHRGGEGCVSSSECLIKSVRTFISA